MLHLYIIGIFEGIFASLFFLLRKKRQPSLLTGGIFMAFLTLLLIVIAKDDLMGHGPALFPALRHSIPFTFGPFLYLYTTLMIEEKQQFDISVLLHFLPFSIIFFIMLAGVTIHTPGELPLLPPRQVQEFTSFFPNPETRWIIVFVCANLSYIIYTVLILTRLKYHKKNLGDYFSNESSDITLHWLMILTILFIFSNILISILILLFPRHGNDSILNPDISITYGLIFFIFAFALFSGKQPVIYNNRAEKDTGNSRPKRYEKSGLKEDDITRYISELGNYMKEHKTFLNSELTILDVSESLGLKRHYITQILNDVLNVNFNTYINNLRLEYVIEKMKKNIYSDVSLLELALDSGFNSKTTFNRVFKNKTGKTPTQYKKNLETD